MVTSPNEAWVRARKPPDPGVREVLHTRFAGHVHPPHGEPLASVAAEVGFCDQAHLTRRFKQFLGTTPGRYAGGPSAWRS